ncbi:MAG: hypothetical protein R2817_07030 [Flavobacteriales bacterium]
MRPGVRNGENLHILLWLLKDLCWVMDLRVAGLLLVAPTIGVAFWICWRWRLVRSEFVHALAVVLWILANSTWMIGEFYLEDRTRPVAILFFMLGLLVLAGHYIATWRVAAARRTN